MTENFCNFHTDQYSWNNFWYVFSNIFRSGLIHTHHLENIKPEAHITIMSKILAFQPEPIWPSIIQLLLCHDMKVAKVLILNFGAFVPSQGQNSNSSRIIKPMSNGCKGFQCSNNCIGPADHTWPQAIGSGVVKIVLSGMRSNRSLIELFEPLFEKLAPSSWENVGFNHIWNSRRPIWFNSLIHLIEPHLTPLIKDLMVSIDSNRSWTLSQVTIGNFSFFAEIHSIWFKWNFQYFPVTWILREIIFLGGIWKLQI